ncbi:MAG TPA: hypothetical protein VLH79_11705 [Chthonomonadales bacterium]|nr:hypothetical protein [Chthonomonadales bacterium]
MTESVVEEAALACLRSAGWLVRSGAGKPPAGDTLALALSQEERANYGEVVLAQRLRDALVPQLISGELRVKERSKLIGVTL